MRRREFIKTTGLSIGAILFRDNVFTFFDNERRELISLPDRISAVMGIETVFLEKRKKTTWFFKDLELRLKYSKDHLSVIIQSEQSPISEIRLHWDTTISASSSILNDAWERAYGDLSWHSNRANDVLPWYFLEYTGSQTTNGWGIKTGANAFCYWQLDPQMLDLVLDTRSGANGVKLNGRELKIASIVSRKGIPGESSFQSARALTKMMCPHPLLPQQPVYGINDWYFSYGFNSEAIILEHTSLIAPLTEGLANRPYSIVDAGWYKKSPGQENNTCWGIDMITPSESFTAMDTLAQKIREKGMKPGIWTRPLCGNNKDSPSVLLPLSNGRSDPPLPVLDPSLPENLARISDIISLYKSWTYELIKFDFTTYDIFGKWGYEMMQPGNPPAANWKMYDESKTNAEIINALYSTIRKAAGNICVISCNSISHLSAGHFELNRIGDDTSGKNWNQTVKMGVNALGLRGIQHGHFYAADADCVGLTTKIPWEKNKQWMELLSKSSTPFFISAETAAVGDTQKSFMKECFKTASENNELAEPLDWIENKLPSKWKLAGEIRDFNWA